MKNVKKWTVAALFIAVTSLVVTDLMAQSGRKPRVQRLESDEREMIEPGQMRIERMTQRLNLTQEQQTAVAELHESARVKSMDLRKQIERVRHELKGEMLKDSPNERTVIQLTEQLGKLRTDLQVNRVKTRLAVRAQLTPEQRDKMILMHRSGSRFDRHGAEGRRGMSEAWGGCPLHHGPGHAHPRAGRKAGRF
jgi:Spy/CpxP family protein refolding chaperone